MEGLTVKRKRINIVFSLSFYLNGNSTLEVTKPNRFILRVFLFERPLIGDNRIHCVIVLTHIGRFRLASFSRNVSKNTIKINIFNIIICFSFKKWIVLLLDKFFIVIYMS